MKEERIGLDIIVSLIVLFLLPYAVMLAFGVLHRAYPVVHPFGYWETFVIVVSIKFLTRRSSE